MSNIVNLNPKLPALENKQRFGWWFRYYAGAIDDPKVQTLPDALFRTWLNVLCIAAKSEGRIPDWTELSFRLRLSATLTKKRIEALIVAGLIDRREDGLRPHNWDARQCRSDSSAARMRAFRDRHKPSGYDHRGGESDVTTEAGDASRDGRCEVTSHAQNGDVTRDVTLSPSYSSSSVVLSNLSNQGRKVSEKGTVGPATDRNHGSETEVVR